ncbi:Pc22g01910 [Penicillium rubens Wisconsin 54-1255]|uniref:Pc22g01910 protein n=1 Tax=Penicillium rubens (strain ATCC 28089 / DSM 1075 / NRRL 1951 / Wisconsin 54-1255) TaxID=500485 RepID=B6HPC1_PENRW|nr:Pc22g01910 [Penicillium rubens Wisconsin 54-1255]
MDQAIQRLLNDKLYDRRKQGALELEKIVRDAVFQGEQEKIQKIVEQLCHDYAYAVHQPHARNGGLIGLAAASIALGSEGVAPYLGEIVPPVLACFSDQDARVRYYACESMYNIAKVAKGEILLFFNEVFDALAKLASDSELSVKNGAELLDRLVKDIVAESAASYVSILQLPEKEATELENQEDQELPMAFSLARFIPLLKDRIHVIQPFTRNFLVSWLTLLDTIPDLELVSYLPEFLEGLIKFLGGPNKDVNIATQGLLDRFLAEIKRITRLKKGIEESRKSQKSNRQSVASDVMSNATEQNAQTDGASDDRYDVAVADSVSDTTVDDEIAQADGDWIPGQDVQIDHPKILDILVGFVNTSYEEEMQLTALRWLDSFFEISPEDILPFVPRLLTQVLPAMSSGSDQVRKAANQVNTSLVQYIYSLSDDTTEEAQAPSSKIPSATASKETIERRSSTPGVRPSETASSDTKKQTVQENSVAATPRSSVVSTPLPPADLDYAAAVNSLTLQFLNENEATRVAALVWLIMLHRKAPRKVVAFNDGTFPALLKTLSDPSEAVVTKDLQLLSQISRNSEDSYFTSFMVNLLQLFSTDRHLLEVRGNLIIRQLSLNLSPERIYRTLADCLEKEEDLEFASIMVQNLNNNLITAPELSELRKRLRNLDSKDGQMFFVGLFRSWCHNAVSTFSLCLLAQAYEQAYNLLQILSISASNFLNPKNTPSSTNVSTASSCSSPRAPPSPPSRTSILRFTETNFPSTTQTAPPFDRSTGTRLKPRDENSIRWVELLDKFKSVQERARRSQGSTRQSFDQSGPINNPSLTAALSVAAADRPKDRSGLPDAPRGAPGPSNAAAGNAGLGGSGAGVSGTAASRALDSAAKGASSTQRHRSGLPNLGRLGIGGRRSKK